MKIQIASDLHFELWKRDLPDRERQFAPDKDRDLLILAGDIVDGNRDHGMPFIRRELKISPVLFVPGNHEYHHAPKAGSGRLLARLRRAVPRVLLSQR